MLKFKGNVPDVVWFPTGLWSLDHLALADLNNHGVPLRSVIEIFGQPESGKSTLSYYIAGKVTQEGSIVIADLEANMNPKYVLSAVGQSGQVGDIEVIDYVDKKNQPRSHEEMMEELRKAIKREEVGALILDSYGVVTPLAERKAKFGEHGVGGRAKLVAQFSRDVIAWLRASIRPKLVIGINHVLQPIGGRGYITPGGDTKNFAANARLRMYRIETLNDGSFCAEVKAEKLKYGGTHKNRKGLVYIIPDIGVSPEMTAVFDCFKLGLAERSTTVKIGGKSVGYLEKTLLAAAKDGKKEKFEPFFSELISVTDMEFTDEDSEEE